VLTGRLAPTSEGGCVNITSPKTRFLLSAIRGLSTGTGPRLEASCMGMFGSSLFPSG
jgi:hypothetical protein